MSKFEQNEVSMRFIEVLDELLETKKVRNDAEFCKVVDYEPQSLGQIRKGKRNVTIEVISKLLTEFNGNPIYLLSGRGEKLLTEYALNILEDGETNYETKDVNTDVHESKRNQVLTELVKTKDELITYLKKDNARLEAELKKSGLQSK